MTYTHIAVLVDRSYSMGSIRQEMIGGLGAFFESQIEVPGDCLVDYAQFDTFYEKVYEDVPISKAYVVLEPRGSTALLDSMGKLIKETKSKIKEKPKNLRPDQVLVIVVTDGQENASHKFKRDDIKAMVKDRESKGWKFVFIGANMDAVAEASLLGISRDSALTFNTSSDGILATSSALSTYAGSYRTAGAASFSDADRDNANQ